MPRLNIEDRFFDDIDILVPHFADKDQAMGHALRWFRYAQNKYIEGREITEEMFKTMKFNEALFPTFAQRAANGIQAASQDRHFGWLRKGIKQRSDAGKKSAQRARNAKGQLLPQRAANETPTVVQREPNASQPSSSSSSSFNKPSLVPKEGPRTAKETFALGDNAEFYRRMTEFKSGWLKLYDAPYLERELDKALLWLKANPHKNRKTLRGWQQFFSGWFDRGWDKAQTRWPSTQPAKQNWDSAAALVKATFTRYGAGSVDQVNIKAALGPELYPVVLRAGSHLIRQVPDNAFYIRTVAGMLAAAAEIIREAR